MIIAQWLNIRGRTFWLQTNKGAVAMAGIGVKSPDNFPSQDYLDRQRRGYYKDDQTDFMLDFVF